MSKTLDQITFKEVILSELSKERIEFEENYDFDYYEEKNPYGDTWATTSSEPTDESLERCQEEFKEKFDVFDFITEKLSQNEDFKFLIMDLVENERY